MRYSLAGLVLAPLLAAADTAHRCLDDFTLDDEACRQPIPDVLALTSSSYTAKLRCTDCVYVDRSVVPDQQVEERGDYDLLFNVTLSHDNRTVLVNGWPFFPTLPTTPTPPILNLGQLPPTFSYADLSLALHCRHSPKPWCSVNALGSVFLDYLYITKTVDAQHDEKDLYTHHWTFDVVAIGAPVVYGQPTLLFDIAVPNMLRVSLAGTELAKNSHRSDKERQAESSLFGSSTQEEPVYNLTIVSVDIIKREYKMPKRIPLTLWDKVRRFFGHGIWQAPGQLVYFGEDWGHYGKNGSLRNMLGVFIHWEYWFLFWLILGSTIAGLVAMYAIYRLYFWIMEQRELMKWDGIDHVWDKLRRVREEEERALLHDRYQDDPDQGGSSRLPRYTDDVDTMKPLPTKPLPEKPLPEVPLIDA